MYVQVNVNVETDEAAEWVVEEISGVLDQMRAEASEGVGTYNIGVVTEIAPVRAPMVAGRTPQAVQDAIRAEQRKLRK